MEIISHFCTEIASLSDQLRDISIQGKKIIDVTFSLLIIINYKKGGKVVLDGFVKGAKGSGKAKKVGTKQKYKERFFYVMWENESEPLSAVH